MNACMCVSVYVYMSILSLAHGRAGGTVLAAVTAARVCGPFREHSAQKVPHTHMCVRLCSGEARSPGPEKPFTRLYCRVAGGCPPPITDSIADSPFNYC